MRDSKIFRSIVLSAGLVGFLEPAVAIDKNLAVRPEAQSATSTNDADLQKIKELIAQLGSDDFLTRREAESQIIAMGAMAFDHLQEAQNNADLEIATQAEYLLHRITVDYWIRSDDSEEVRELMKSYAKVSLAQRREIIGQLGVLNDAMGVGALSRISHFELSPRLAKFGALAVLGAREKHLKLAETVALSIRQEIGDSPRDTAQWLRTYADQLQDTESISPEWLSLIDAEAALLKDEPEETSLDVVIQLMQFHIQLCADEKHPAELFESLRRRIDLVVDQGGTPRDILAKTLLWTMNEQEWEALELMEAHYGEQLKQDRLLLYLVAIVRAERGQDHDAKEIAGRAFDLVKSDNAERANIADIIAEYGHHDWAEKEWRFVIDHSEVASQESMDARRSLASWCLHDRGEDQEAAELMAEVCDAVDADPQLKQRVMHDNELRYLMSDLRKSREFFTACDLNKKGDHAAERKHLDLAYAYQTDMQDPDILIAMYRLPNQDEAYRAKVKERIRQAANDVDQLIEKYPDEALWYNHWAWLVSNTEGDFSKAVRYSHRSLELSPDSPSYLDTLGRCYYAAGDLGSAIKYQRQAVEKHPQVQVMRRQLTTFEKALAESKLQDKGQP